MILKNKQNVFTKPYDYYKVIVITVLSQFYLAVIPEQIISNIHFS